MWKSHQVVAPALAALLVAGSALAGAEAELSVRPPAARGGLCDPADAERRLDERRGPFFGIRVNAMDMKADAKNVACFEYACHDIARREVEVKYQLVRTVWRGDVTPDAKCDETLGLEVAPGASVRYIGRMMTTRWIRDVGPNGRTPVGGFVGRFSVAVTRGDAADAPVIPLLALGVVGTQGLRPGRNDPSVVYPAEDADRCSSPLHDEGYYSGGYDRRGLTVLALGAQQAGRDIAIYRALSKARIVGTFEGRLELDPAVDVRPFRFCALSSGAWSFDGLLGWRCRPHRHHVEPSPVEVR